MSENKTRPTKAKVEDYIASLPNDRKMNEAKQVVALLEGITGRTPAMWGPSIIGYDRRKYKHGEMPMIAFSPRKARMVFYVINNSDEQKAQLEELGKHKTGVVCLYINKLADVDLDVLTSILKSSWQWAVNKKENE